MLKFYGSTDLKGNFGDFGKEYTMIDIEFERKLSDSTKLRNMIESEEFEKLFRKLLVRVTGEKISLKRYCMQNGLTVHVVPALSKMYLLAGHLALAKLLGKTNLVIGTSDRKFALMAAETSAFAGFSDVIVVLGKELCGDQRLTEALLSTGAQVNCEMEKGRLNRPYYYGNTFFGRQPEHYCVPEDANYGVCPELALSGLFAGLYGSDLLELLGKVPDACVVPIGTGIEAIGLFRALLDTKCILATSEDTVAQEFHVIKLHCYTLATRASFYDHPLTVLCPELVNWWRNHRVFRLGCDRLEPVDTSFLNGADLSRRAARAVVLAYEKTGCRDMVVMEVEG